MQKLRSIQSLRAVAACAVVILHAYGFSRAQGPMRLGAAGVDLFFVISGVIMTMIAKGKSPGGFLLDRIWRIYPMWLLAVFPWLLANRTGFPTTIASLTLWPVFDQFTMPALPLGWTLSFEMLFYVALVLALLTRPIVPLVLYVVAMVASLFSQAAIFDYVGNPMILEFLAGVAVVKLPRKQALAVPAIAAGIIVFMLSPTWIYLGEVATHAPDSAPRALWWGTAAALIVYGSLSLEKVFKRPFFNLPVMLGDASFSIYLFHMLVVRMIDVPWVEKAALSIAFGVAIHFAIERRITRLKPNWFSRSAPARIARA